MLLMLFLTLAWLLHVVYVQSGTGFTVRLIFYALLFWFILWLRDFSSHLEYEQLSAQSRARAIRWFNVFLPFWPCCCLSALRLTVIMPAAVITDKTKTLPPVSVISRQINAYVRQGKTVIVAVDADWCLTCRYNDVMVFKTRPSFRN